MVFKMAQMKPGDKGVVLGLTAGKNIRRRLQDIGLICGTTVECLFKSPMGDPTAFLIRRAVVALRYEDSERVEVEILE